MNPQYASNLAAAASTNANLGGSPNGDSGDIQHLQNLGQIQFRAGAAGAATQGFGSAASAQADQEAASAKAAQAIKDKEDEVKQKLLDAYTDPNNFKKTASQDGGWDFYDPMGQKINAQQYAGATGKQITDVLKDSNNAKDQTFVKDYQTLLSYGRALAGSKDDADDFKKKNPGWLEANAKDKSFADVATQFKDYYSGYLGGNGNLLNSLPTKNQAGQNVTGDTLAQGGGNLITSWLRNKQGVNYR